MDEYLSRKIKVLSLISIVAVVYIHAYNLADRYLLPWSPILDPPGINSFTQYFVANGLTRFAVPLFFAISGFLYFRNLTPDPTGFAEKFIKRLGTIGVPYLLWSAWGLALTTALLQIPAIRPAIDYWEIRDAPATMQWFLYRLFINPVPFQLWFLRDLLIYVFLAPLMYFALRYLSFFALLPPLLVWFFQVWFFHFDMKVLEAEGLLFFMIGAWLSIKEIAPPRNGRVWLPLTLLVLWLFLLFVKTLFAYQGNSYATPAVLIPLHKIAILCGFFAVWLGYDIFGERANASPALMTLAPLTFFLYAAHEPTLNLLSNAALYALGATPTTQLTVFLVIPAVTIVLCLLIGATLRQLVPLVFFVLTGGRGN